MRPPCARRMLHLNQNRRSHPLSATGAVAGVEKRQDDKADTQCLIATRPRDRDIVPLIKKK